MSNIFNFSRFGKMLEWDLKNIIRTWGLSFLTVIAIPFIIEIFVIGSHIVLGSPDAIQCSQEARLSVFIGILCAFCTFFPAIAYGFVTDKKLGSRYVLLPASVTEKFISMLFCSLVIVPAALVGGYLISDGILSIVGLNQGDSLAKCIINNASISSGDDITFNLLGVVYMGFTINMLTFLLGALWFKYKKVAKTILAIFALNVVFWSVAATFFNQVAFDTEFLENLLERFLMMDVSNMELVINLVLYSYFLVGFSVLGALVFWRLKTVKH